MSYNQDDGEITEEDFHEACVGLQDLFEKFVDEHDEFEYNEETFKEWLRGDYDYLYDDDSDRDKFLEDEGTLYETCDGRMISADEVEDPDDLLDPAEYYNHITYPHHDTNCEEE